MNFGYLIFATGKDADYLQMAYALAITIKLTQKPGYDRVCLVTDSIKSVSKLNSPWVFDQVVPWKKRAKGWDCRLYMDQYSPWDQTVCLDADMLFFSDYSHLIDLLIKERISLYYPKTAYTFSGNKVTSDYYRKCISRNELPNTYSFFTYFDKSCPKTFFDLSRTITKYSTEFKNNFFEKYVPEIIGTDEAFSLSSKLLELVVPDLELPKIVHLKPMVQDRQILSDTVTNQLGFYFNEHCELKIGEYLQSGIVHYVDKTLITQEIISLLEEKLWKN